MIKRSLSCVAGLAGLAALTVVCLPQPAKAWVVIGLPPVVFGAPVAPYPPPAYYYPPPPAYYYPPAYGYYPPPPAPAAAPQSSAQNAQDTRPYGSMCHAGVYSCAAPYRAHVGDGCSCAGIGAPSYGTVN